VVRKKRGKEAKPGEPAHGQQKRRKQPHLKNNILCQGETKEREGENLAPRLKRISCKHEVTL